MPGPSLVAVGASSHSTGSTTCAYPANVQRGALLFLYCESHYAESVTLSDAQGFVKLCEQDSTDSSAGSGTRLTLFWKEAEGTDPAAGLGDAMTVPTIADPGDHIFCRMVAYCNHMPGEPIEQFSTEGFASTAANTNISLTGLTTRQIADEIFYFVADSNDSAALRGVTYVAGTGAGAVEGNDLTAADSAGGTTDGGGGGVAFVASNVNPNAAVGAATWKSTLGPAGYAAAKVVVQCPIIRHVTTNTQASTGDATVAWPTHVAGDFGLLWVQTANQNVTTPAGGWTFLCNVGVGTPGAAGASALWVYYRIATSSSEPAVTVLDAGDHTSARLSRFPGARGVNAFATATGVAASTAVMPSVTTTVDQCCIVYLASTATNLASHPFNTGVATRFVGANTSPLTGPSHTIARVSGTAVLGTVPGASAMAMTYQRARGALGTNSVGVVNTTDHVLVTLALEPAGAQVAFTQAPDTVAATVTQTDKATVSFTQAANTVAATVAQLDTAQVAFTQAANTVAATVQQSDGAVVAFTQAPNTVSAAVTQTDNAVVAFTQAPDTVAAIVTHPTVAVVAFTQANNTVAAAASQLNTAAVNFTQAAQTVAATAIQVDGATIAFTQAGDTVVAEVQLPSVGTDSPAYGVQPITVNWTRLGDKGADTIIALARQGADEADMVAWVYTNGTQVAPVSVVANGSYTFPAITTPGTYVARVITSGAGPAWTVDPDSGIGVPADATEWDAVLAAAGIASGGPANIWLCQDASSVLVDVNGALNLGVSGDGSQTYQQTVPGWDRKGVQFVDGASARFEATIPGGGTSFLAMFYLRLISAPAATRTALEHPNIFAEVNSTPRYQADGNSLVVGTVNPGFTVHPVMLGSNATALTEGVFTDDEKIIPTYNTFAGTAMRLGTVGGNGSPAMQAVYGVRFTGSAAELSSTQKKTLLQVLNWTVPWTP